MTGGKKRDKDDVKEMIRHEPGSDKWYIRFTDNEMTELIWNSESLVECFNLNKKIGNYKGVRPISLEAWEIEALYEVYNHIFENNVSPGNELYVNKDTPAYQGLLSLVTKLKVLYDDAFRD
jgi:hypothetical protein